MLNHIPWDGVYQRCDPRKLAFLAECWERRAAGLTVDEEGGLKQVTGGSFIKPGCVDETPRRPVFHPGPACNQGQQVFSRVWRDYHGS